MSKLFVATNNKHKLEEMKDIFNSLNYNVELVCPKDFNDTTEPLEDGLSFKENAYIKEYIENNMKAEKTIKFIVDNAKIK